MTSEKWRTGGEAETYSYGEPPEYAPWPAETHWIIDEPPKTQHLPDQVVSNEFALILVSRTTKESPRRGSFQLCLNFGGRLNPKNLTEAEVAYLREWLSMVVRAVSTEQESEIESND